MAYGLADVVQQKRLIDQSEAGDDFKRVSSAKLDALLGLCETAGCRRVRLLGYFGESTGPCGNCDTCIDPPLTWDATEAARKALSAIYRTGQRFGAMHLIDVLRGRDNERVQRWDHQRLSVFGIGSELEDGAWRNVIRQLVALGYVRVDHDAYGALRLAPASRAVLRGELRVEMRHLAARVRQRTKKLAPVSAELSTPEQELLVRLKAWRLDQARVQAVPPYVIFHDSTLTALAHTRPQDQTALAATSGIGSKKLERYGSALLELLRFGEAAGEINPQQ
jgi:ATP-dependent DNA helicase RecQ